MAMTNEELLRACVEKQAFLERRVARLEAMAAATDAPPVAQTPVGDWDMHAALDLGQKGVVVVWMPTGLSDGERARAWAAVARCAQDPQHKPQNPDAPAEFTESVGGFLIAHPAYPDTAAMEFMLGVNELRSASQSLVAHLESMGMVTREEAPLVKRVYDVLEKFG